MKRKLRQASRLRLVTVPYTESPKKAPPVTNSVEKMEAWVYWKTMLEKTLRERAEGQEHGDGCANGRALRDRVERDAEQEPADQGDPHRRRGVQFPASSIW